MDIKTQKHIILHDLGCLREECTILLERINSALKDLKTVETLEDAMEFDKAHDLEAGLRYIRF